MEFQSSPKTKIYFIILVLALSIAATIIDMYFFRENLYKTITGASTILLIRSLVEFGSFFLGLYLGIMTKKEIEKHGK